jgi:intein-encoded DNA endonuclease-like protein
VGILGQSSFYNMVVISLFRRGVKSVRLTFYSVLAISPPGRDVSVDFL